MEIITQKNELLTIRGDVDLNGKSIFFKDILLGQYETPDRACKVFAELTCHSWNNVSGIFKMPLD